MSEADPVTPALRAQYKANELTVLWESSNAFLPSPEQSHHWPWRSIRPVALETAKITSPAIVERRVMNLVNPTIPRNDTDTATGLLNAGIQALMPGESARPHRHTMHALRFVLEGSGAETIVEGKHCPMEPGDLVVTPGWTWHEHHNQGGAPTIWVDILDVSLHRAFGTAAFQPGPARDIAPAIDDAAFVSGAFVPVVARTQHPDERSYTPMFRYAAADAQHAVAVAPIGADGLRVIRYSDPVNGGPVLPTIDCYLSQIDGGTTSRAVRSNASSVCVVVDGTGETSSGDTTIRWSPGDVFTLPQGRWVTHRCISGPARIFSATNREVYRRLGFLVEELAA